MAALFITLLGALIFTACYERSHALAKLLVVGGAQCLPEQIASGREEQWLADINDIEGGLWKVITALGCIWQCRCHVVAKYTGIKLGKPYVVMIFPSDGSSASVSSSVWVMDKRCAYRCLALITDGIKAAIVEQIGQDEFDQRWREMDSRSATEEEARHVFESHVLPADFDTFVTIKDGTLTLDRIG